MLSTLQYLKSRILPAASVEDTTWDDALLGLGAAVMRRMESHCARFFSRAVGAVDEFSAANKAFCLLHFPVETVTKIELKANSTTLATCDANGYSWDPKSGLVEFLWVPGVSGQRLAITYTGGYWIDPLDGTAMPTGATALPDDLLETWVAEVQLQAEARGLFEAAGLRSPKDAAKAPRAGLSDSAIAALSPYRRFSGE